MQQPHRVLPVSGQIVEASNDQRRRQRLDSLRRNMGMHPMRARPGREIIRPAFAWRQHGHRQVGNAILKMGRNLSMPVDDRSAVEPVCQIYPEPLARVTDQPRTLRPEQTKDGGRPTVDLERSAGGGKRYCRRLCGSDARQMCQCQRRSARGEKAAS